MAMNPLIQAASGAPVVSLIDINYILINRIFVLVVTLLFFGVVAVLRRTHGQEAGSGVTGPIKLSLFGFILLYAELVMSNLPSYQALIQGVQTIVVLLCLARLVTYLSVDVYLRIHTQREVPSFLRDSVRLVVYLAVGIVSLRLVFKIDLSAIVTTTTVITATIAFAMQSTLTNALSGFSIQSDRLLARGNWISIKEKNIFGEIVNVGFRYTTLKNPENHLIMVPNSVIMQNLVTYHGNRYTEEKPALQVDVMLGYDMPPETAKAVLLKVLRDDSEVLDQPEPLVRLLALHDSGITYQLKFCIEDPSQKVPVQDALYSQIWYAVNRAGYSFPYPHRQIITAESRQPFEFSKEHVAGYLRASGLFAMLDTRDVELLAEQAPVAVYGASEVVVRQGDTGSSLFIVMKGSLGVSIDGTTVGHIHQGSFFGEMSLLTGEPRMATVRADSEVWLAEVTKEIMEPVLHANPALLEALSSILVERERKSRASRAVNNETSPSPPRSEDYLQRLKSFFGL
jgi:small-conductance mechanosensitive channel/CRP-like cAMP-binding protein